MSMLKETEFKSMPLAAIYRDEQDRYPFQFGVRKAELILKHIDEIRAFVIKHGKQPA